MSQDRDNWSEEDWSQVTELEVRGFVALTWVGITNANIESAICDLGKQQNLNDKNFLTELPDGELNQFRESSLLDSGPGEQLRSSIYWGSRKVSGSDSESRKESTNETSRHLSLRNAVRTYQATRVEGNQDSSHKSAIAASAVLPLERETHPTGFSVSDYLTLNWVATFTDREWINEIKGHVLSPFKEATNIDWGVPFVTSVVHVVHDENLPIASKVVTETIAHQACLGIPPTALPDDSFGQSKDYSRRSRIFQRAADWIYFAAPRRFGSIALVLRDDLDAMGTRRYAIRFIDEMKPKITGLIALGLIPHYIFEFCKRGMSTFSDDPRTHLRNMKQSLEMMLRTELDTGSGYVSGRHGVQMMYETLSSGLGLDDDRAALRQNLQSRIDLLQAELQEIEADLQRAETTSQKSIENFITFIGSFLAGALSFLSVYDSVTWSGKWNFLGLGFSKSALEGGEPSSVFIVALVWGLVVFAFQFLVRRLWRRRSRWGRSSVQRIRA